MNEGDECALAAVPTRVISGCTTGDSAPLIRGKAPSPHGPGPVGQLGSRGAEDTARERDVRREAVKGGCSLRSQQKEATKPGQRNIFMHLPLEP